MDVASLTTPPNEIIFLDGNIHIEWEKAMLKKNIIAIAGVVILIGAGMAYASVVNPRHDEIQKFHSTHTHSGSGTINAPQHSGGTDRYGCHNASVPYHCH